MNENLNNALVELINSALVAKDFVLGELPEVINQLLLWKAVENGVMAVMFIIPAFLLFKTAKYYWKTEKYDKEIPTLLFGCLGLIPTIGVVVSILTVLQIWIAPKVYLIEYAAQLAK